MKRWLSAIPLPFSAVILSVFALGNLLQSYSPQLRLCLGGLGLVLWAIFLAKCILFFSAVKQAITTDAVVSSVTGGTFPMATMLLASYAKPFLPLPATVLWYLGTMFHCAMIVLFTARFVFGKQKAPLLASHFVVYVGIAVQSLTSPAFNAGRAFSMAGFWVGFVCLWVLLVAISKRYLTTPVPQPPAKPLFCIYAAPMSLCLAAYLAAAEQKQLWLVTLMMAVAGILYLMGLYGLFKSVKLPFYPSYAAFTFPFAISAVATKQAATFYQKQELALGNWMQVIVLLQTILAVVLVGYVLVRYGMAIAKAASTPKLELNRA